jgi:hypothetical protein
MENSKSMNKKERQQRIIARGEHSNHSHVLTGDITFTPDGKIIVGEDSNAVIKHLLETDWLEGREVWTGEHTDITLQPGIYEYVPQIVYDPLEKRIEAARD